MDKKSQALLILLVVLSVLSVGYTFYKTVIKQDFEVVNTEPEVEPEAAMGASAFPTEQQE